MHQHEKKSAIEGRNVLSIHLSPFLASDSVSIIVSFDWTCLCKTDHREEEVDFLCSPIGGRELLAPARVKREKPAPYS
jgi:hypothetical protein